MAGKNIVLVAVNRGRAKDITWQGSLGFVPGIYRGLIADVSPANASNYGPDRPDFVLEADSHPWSNSNRYVKSHRKAPRTRQAMALRINLASALLSQPGLLLVIVLPVV